MNQLVYLGLGGNQGDVRDSLERTLGALLTLPHSQVLRWSKPWHTPPWGETSQAPFLNAAVCLSTGLAPVPLLQRLLQIERALGRVRDGQRWGPRLIDTDLLLYGQRTIHHPKLQVPHPYMHQRAFVLCPLLELVDSLNIPGQGDAHQCLQALDCSGHNAADFELVPKKR
jgi:2-amino-4-hydroxy-6-hydroxymethyldihydropteridine diphosphokinase